ncbi:unnamed protein product [Hydatigera taeniaeformis]|uniref:CWF19-like protein 2 n=1 Tax=Hydatigena taeniaeformis TaxID=6205 RepID=A0A0R3XBJ3_HYDTA|nr:unnamed protein product [Hydatigera taeniaeformis]
MLLRVSRNLKETYLIEINIAFQKYICSFNHSRERSNHHGGKGRQNEYPREDEGSYTIEEMIRQENQETKDSYLRHFASVAGQYKGVADEYETNFVKENAKLQGVLKPRLGSDAITEYKRREYAESTCPSCMDHTPHYLVISVRHRMFLSLPEHVSLSQGHCFITPLEHVGAMTRLDKAAVEEACAFKRDLCRMAALWKGKGASCVFMEVASYSTSFKHHTQIECVPVSRETMDELPSYFKKAMLDLGSEWDQNTRLIDLARLGARVRKIIPPNFGYFCVEFGVDGGGYAKVIDNWSTFPPHFGQEVLSGVLGKSPEKWRKPKKESLEQLRRKVVEFEEKWISVEEGANETNITTQHTEAASTIPDAAECVLEPEGPALPP